MGARPTREGRALSAAPLRILLCAAQVPFVEGGAEVLTETLRGELCARGHEVDVVRLPFGGDSHEQVLRHALLWRLADLDVVEGQPVDLMIATRFPSYLARHPHKVVWLVHQYRQVYDLLGTEFSDFGPDDQPALEALRRADERGLNEARRIFGISQNVADRLERHNGLRAGVLYPPPKLGERYRSGPYGDFVLSVGRLNAMKRFDLLLRTIAATETPVRCRIVGRGPEQERLQQLIGELGIEERVELLGFVDDERLLELYAEALAVYYAPFDEDYGYVTVEAFKAARPVLSLADAGGVLELVEDGVNGFVGPAADTRVVARRIDQLYRDRGLAARLGAAGARAVAGIGWDAVIDGLLAGTV